MAQRERIKRKQKKKTHESIKMSFSFSPPFLMILVNVPIIRKIQTAPTLIFPYSCVNAFIS